MHRDDARALGQATVVLFGLVLAFLLVRVVSDLHRSHERARLVRSLVQEQRRGLAAAEVRETDGELRRPWPNDFLLLEGWLVVQASRGKPPEEIRQNLLALEKGQIGLSDSMKAALARWKDGLERWAREASLPSEGSGDALQRGRQHFLEAQGYSGVGRRYDAAVLYLWAAYGISRSVELSRSDGDFAEALYLLGMIYQALRHSFPGLFHGKQLLFACSDLYPSSIWASRANAARHSGIQ